MINVELECIYKRLDEVDYSDGDSKKIKKVLDGNVPEWYSTLAVGRE